MSTLPPTRQLKNLGDIFDVRDGTHDSPKFYSDGYALITSKNLKDDGLETTNVKYISEEDYIAINQRSKVDKGDLLFAMIGTIGNPTIIEEEPNFAIKNVALFKPKTNESLIDYLRYFLLSQSTIDKMINESKGATQKFVGLGYLRKFKIPLPPLPTQHAIVAKLDEVSESITSSTAHIHSQLDHLDELWASSLSDMMGHHIGKLTKLGSLCDFVRGPFGGSLKKEIFKPSGFAIYEQQHAIYDQFSEIRYFIDEQKFNEMKRFELLPGDLIMSCSGTMGKIAIVPPLIKQGIINQALLKLTTSERINVKFLKLRMESDNFQNGLQEYSQGAAIKNVASVKILKQIQIPLPSLEVQTSIVSQLDGVSQTIGLLRSQYLAQLQHYDELWASVLDQAFCGELISE